MEILQSLSPSPCITGYEILFPPSSVHAAIHHTHTHNQQTNINYNKYATQLTKSNVHQNNTNNNNTNNSGSSNIIPHEYLIGVINKRVLPKIPKQQQTTKLNANKKQNNNNQNRKKKVIDYTQPNNLHQLFVNHNIYENNHAMIQQNLLILRYIQWLGEIMKLQTKKMCVLLLLLLLF